MENQFDYREIQRQAYGLLNLAEERLGHALSAAERGDIDIAYEVIGSRHQLRAIQRSIESLAARLLSSDRLPANNAKRVVDLLKAVKDIEHVANLTLDLAWHGTGLSATGQRASLAQVLELAHRGIVLLEEARRRMQALLPESEAEFDVTRPAVRSVFSGLRLTSDRSANVEQKRTVTFM